MVRGHKRAETAQEVGEQQCHRPSTKANIAAGVGSEDRDGMGLITFFFSSRRRHTRLQGDWSSDVCSSDLVDTGAERWRVPSNGLAPIAHTDDTVVVGPAMGASGGVGSLDRRTGARRWMNGLRSEERRVGKEGRSRWSPYP